MRVFRPYSGHRACSRLRAAERRPRHLICRIDQARLNGPMAIVIRHRTKSAAILRCAVMPAARTLCFDKRVVVMIFRRTLFAAGLTLVATRPLWAQSRPRVVVWRDPTCGCCANWVAHLRAEGFAVDDKLLRSLAAIRQELGTPDDLLSCHAGVVDGLALEGHVPAAAIRRLLAERPPGVRGLAVPDMPIGSPGMEVPGQRADTYDVIAFGIGPHRPFMRFTGSNPA